MSARSARHTPLQKARDIWISYNPGASTDDIRNFEIGFRSGTASQLAVNTKEGNRGDKNLARIRDIILAAESMCMATDGPVPKTISMMTDHDIKAIYELTFTK